MTQWTAPVSPDDAFAGASSASDGQTNLSYFNTPVLKKPHWEWEVVTYLFLGGIMGGCGMIAAFADASGDPGDREVVRNARYASLALASACPLILIKHLGRPERFHHMLRVVKFKSVMSMGVWGLVSFSALAGLSALGQLTGCVRSVRILNLPQAVLGGFIAGYTGVLISATAIPIWASGKRHIPAISVCSSLAAACALNTALLCWDARNSRAVHKLERLEGFASLCEAVLLAHFRLSSGQYGKPMFEGLRGRRLRNDTIFAGIAIPVALNLTSFARFQNRNPQRFRTLLASALTLRGGYLLREAFIESGKTSADDPKVAFRQPQ